MGIVWHIVDVLHRGTLRGLPVLVCTLNGCHDGLGYGDEVWANR